MAGAGAGEPLVVQAIYSFKGKNNDELCFKKGDRITVTQKEDGGWWEGTLCGNTGWFPSNYVKECKDAIVVTSPLNQQNRAVVLKDLIDSEKAHVAELQGLVTNFLQPLEKSCILTPDEYKQLTGNLCDVLETHQQLLALLEAEEIKVNAEQRVGRLFLTWAPRIKAVHQEYCALHPRAVCILDKYKEELTKYMESCGAASPGVLVLTVNLSKPFRRLEKYSAMLQELERHTDESHPDRGDTQRSVAVYKDIAATCAATRRQKELELQVLTGPVRGWEGQSLAALGDIIYMGSVAVGPQHHDRYLVLFPSTLLLLSVSHRLSAFIYEGQLPLSGITVTRLEDSELYKNAFELSGPMIEKRIAVCQSKDEANHWVDLLRKHMPNSSQKTTTTSSTCIRHSSSSLIIPQPPPHMSPLAAAAAVGNLITSNRPSGSTTNSTSHQHSTVPPLHNNNNNNNNSGWSATCLRPPPPLRPCLALGAAASNSSSSLCSGRKPTTYREDAMILDVIEAYCSTSKPRNTVNSVDLQATEGGKSTELEQNIIESVQVLRHKLKSFERSLCNVSQQLKDERAARCALQTIVKNHLMANQKEADGIDWPPMDVV